MKIGLGLFRDSLTKDNFQFARQAGVTHLVVHLVDYFRGKHPHLTSGEPETGWGIASGKPWTYEELRDIKAMINTHGLEWEAIENFDPAHWHDVLLDGPKKAQQLENLKQIIRNIGKAGIPIMGYNFSIAGVWGWTHKPLARGNAMTMVFDAQEIDTQTPIPNGMVWNMIYDPDAPSGTVPQVSSEELWQRLEEFLRTILPVAEECGVRLALHPDDPPVESLRGAARLVNHPYKYQKLIELVPSPANGVELCMGSIQEMADGNIYETLDSLSRQHKICYVHFRNVKGKVPYYYEVFLDEGDIDMIRALRILQRNGYDGVLVPDHTPEMSTDAPWHTGMAYALGYMRGTLQALERSDE
ncbi:MAG: mannonate dehydratase [Candidatus Vecturithrix sp.]|jgi:mannonate dehydratase|nr:mannonate dehydratase [Candidatus Vecturithrix sp.]